MTQTQELTRTIRESVAAERFDERFRPAAIFVQSDEQIARAKADCEAQRASLPVSLQKACARADRKMTRLR